MGECTCTPTFSVLPHPQSKCTITKCIALLAVQALPILPLSFTCKLSGLQQNQQLAIFYTTGEPAQCVSKEVIGDKAKIRMCYVCIPILAPLTTNILPPSMYILYAIGSYTFLRHHCTLPSAYPTLLYGGKLIARVEVHALRK